jgi:hypothetical protein
MVGNLINPWSCLARCATYAKQFSFGALWIFWQALNLFNLFPNSWTLPYLLHQWRCTQPWYTLTCCSMTSSYWSPPPYQWHLSFFHNHLHSRQIWHSSAFGVIHLVCTYLQGEGKSVICICLLFNWHCFYHFCILGRGGGHAKWKAHLAMLQITVVSVSQMKVLSMASWKRIIYWW